MSAPTLNIRRLSTAASDFESALQTVRTWSADTDAAVESSVKAIIADVRQRGDRAEQVHHEHRA